MVLGVSLDCADARTTSLSLGTTVATGIEHGPKLWRNAQATQIDIGGFDGGASGGGSIVDGVLGIVRVVIGVICTKHNIGNQGRLLTAMNIRSTLAREKRFRKRETTGAAKNHIYNIGVVDDLRRRCVYHCAVFACDPIISESDKTAVLLGAEAEWTPSFQLPSALHKQVRSLSKEEYVRLEPSEDCRPTLKLEYAVSVLNQIKFCNSNLN
ncbi:hypothetical protein DFJ58DRAFT_918177 [Suillus subalutaceus]|uniref:uncharacterized protein n=1 Tax=Suillus subalutaceus TaxID=48586 RepID=UPI001B8761E7|nr:uncharacterized protein DFJ58DRAFT_918177 [Suillus subalutaceus]KAG1832303.1 hypothetical protein DFJ58DRAFT_918177 [Suillus subalutaceus]